MAVDVLTVKFPLEFILNAVETTSIEYELWSMMQSDEFDLATASMSGYFPNF